MPIDTIGVFSTKGGVGKTTVCCGTASALERMGRQVLVIDCDPNADTSTALGMDPMKEAVTPGTFELLVGRNPKPIVVERVVSRPSEEEVREPTGICLLPADERLVEQQVTLLFPESLKRSLDGLVHPVTGKPFDAIVLDLPTAPRQLIHQGLFAATAAIHVLDAHLFAVRKTQALLAECQNQVDRGFPIVKRHCVVANRVNLSRNRDKELLSMLPSLLESYPQFIVKQDEGLARATADGVPVHDRIQNGDAAKALTSIATWALGEKAEGARA